MQTTEHLAQYGAIGVMLSVFLALFVWMFKALFSRFLNQLDALTAALTIGLKEVVIAVSNLSHKTDMQHRELIDKIKETEERLS